MVVSELIEFLKTQPQDVKVAYRRFSEQCLLEVNEIELQEHYHPRADGWIQGRRPDMETETYLMLPGN